jgi:uncharacterized protein YhaN
VADQDALTDDERTTLWEYVRISPSNHDRSRIVAAVLRIVAARVAQVTADLDLALGDAVHAENQRDNARAERDKARADRDALVEKVRALGLSCESYTGSWDCIRAESQLMCLPCRVRAVLP